MKVEKKVIVGTITTTATAAAIAALNAINGSETLGSLPASVQFIFILLIPGLLSFLTQYQTAHTVRSDPAAQAEAAKEGLAIVSTTAATGSNTSVMNDFTVTGNMPKPPDTR